MSTPRKFWLGLTVLLWISLACGPSKSSTPSPGWPAKRAFTWSASSIAAEQFPHVVPRRADRDRMLAAPVPMPARHEAPGSQPPRELGASAFLRWRVSSAALHVSTCESGRSLTAVGHYAGVWYFGRWQFRLDTWRSVGGSGNPVRANELEQDYRAYLLWKRDGWSQWQCTP